MFILFVLLFVFVFGFVYLFVVVVDVFLGGRGLSIVIIPVRGASKITRDAHVSEKIFFSVTLTLREWEV